MPCHNFQFGTARGIVCISKPLRRRCNRCGRMTRDHRLCDWKIGDGKTCDEELCEYCTHVPAPGKDLCPAHAEAWKTHMKKYPVPIDSRK